MTILKDITLTVEIMLPVIFNHGQHLHVGGLLQRCDEMVKLRIFLVDPHAKEMARFLFFPVCNFDIHRMLRWG